MREDQSGERWALRTPYSPLDGYRDKLVLPTVRGSLLHSDSTLTVKPRRARDWSSVCRARILHHHTMNLVTRRETSCSFRPWDLQWLSTAGYESSMNLKPRVFSLMVDRTRLPSHWAYSKGQQPMIMHGY